MKGLIKNRLTLFGLCIVLFLAAVAILAPFLTKYDPNFIDIKSALKPPSQSHILGTDSLGRDLLSRIVYGSRISLIIGIIAVGISVLVGTSLGVIAGYFGGKIDTAIMRFVDMMLCLPAFFLILTVVALLEPNIINIMVIIGLTSWMGVSRLVRAEALSLREREFVLSARATGAGSFRIITKHILPNALGPVLVSATLGVGGAILVESSLSFLGIGVQPPTPSWGNILLDAKVTLGVAWWLMLYPGFAILVTVLGFNLLGEGLRDAMDPRRINN